MNKDTVVEEEVQKYRSLRGVPSVVIRVDWELDFIRDALERAWEAGVRHERERIALEVSRAGENQISVLSNAENFTGTYWISLNMLYFTLTGRHLNADWENGVIEKNPTIEALLRESSTPPTQEMV